MAPYQPLAMKCVYCPIDTRLNFHQVSKLLKEVQVGPASQLCLNVGTCSSCTANKLHQLGCVLTEKNRNRIRIRSDEFSQV